MTGENKSEILSKIAMGGFLIFIFLFVTLSSFVYFNNTTNVAIRIQTDNEVNKEKTAVNEALTKTLVLKNDSISTFKEEVRKLDSVITTIEQYKEEVKQLQHEKDSLTRILLSFKHSDIQPVGREKE